MLLYLFTLTEESKHCKIEYLYNLFYVDMMDYAKIKLRDAGRNNFAYDAEDTVQNAFVKITRSIDNIDFSRSEKEIKAYVFAILIHEIYNVLNDDELNTDIFENESNDEELYTYWIEEVEKYDDVVRTIRNMDEKYSSTLYFAICKEMPIKSIAQMMGISEKTVYTRLARGKKILINTLKGVKADG